MEPELRLDCIADTCDVGHNTKVVDHGCGDVSGNALAIKYYGGVEWDNLQIADTNDEEGEGRRTEDDEH